MLRLGHISFFGLGILNVLYALSLHDYPISPAYGRLASTGFVIGALSMPTCCFLTAWKVGFRHLFPDSRPWSHRGDRWAAGRLVSGMKLGLLALSGVRARDPELTALGLTLPGFVERSEVIASLPSLGLLTLAGITPNEINLEYVDVPHVKPEPWLPGEFDAVAISSFSAQIKDAYRLADRYRAAGTAVVLGGIHVTALPTEAAAHADAIVIGEGESIWPEVVRDLAGGALKPVYDARTIRFDLANAPLPRYELLDIASQPAYRRPSVDVRSIASSALLPSASRPASRSSRSTWWSERFSGSRACGRSRLSSSLMTTPLPTRSMDVHWSGP